MTENVFDGLKKYFGYDTFKNDIQESAVKAIVKGNRDVYVSMPTGSGKSLCFQLPAVLQTGKVAIVFSPLISLMKDQIEHLRRLKIRAVSLNSKMTEKERAAVLSDLRSMKPDTRLLYVAPEQAKSSALQGALQNLYRRKLLSYFVVDEAHCVSQWGHDFRSDYLKLWALRVSYSGVPWVALTATASRDVRLDIIQNLKLSNPLEFKVPCFRSNLYYDVVFKDCIQDEFADVIEFINDSLSMVDCSSARQDKQNCGIIYCRTRDATEDIARVLTTRGTPVKAYHAGLSARDRAEVQDGFMEGRYRVISATVSFGMGIDKPTVRFVVHWGVAQSVAAYYQESGRAGRDGKPARCRIYHSKAERSSVDFLLKMEAARAKTESKKEKLRASYKSFERMVRYCEEPQCRHGVFAEYFGDAPPRCVDQCDACKDYTGLMKKIDQFTENTTVYRTHRLKVSSAIDTDLYENGREGQKTDENEGSIRERDDSAARKELQKAISEQFRLRKASDLTAFLPLEDYSNSRVRKPEITANKVNGLKVSARESYFDLILECLKKNVVCLNQGEKDFYSALDLESCTEELEYQALTCSSVASLYRRSCMKTVMDIKNSTKNSGVFQKLIPFQGKGVKKKVKPISTPAAIGGFQKASSLQVKPSPPKPKVRSKTSTIKNDFMLQKTVGDYFKSTPSETTSNAAKRKRSPEKDLNPIKIINGVSSSESETEENSKYFLEKRPKTEEINNDSEKVTERKQKSLFTHKVSIEEKKEISLDKQIVEINDRAKVENNLDPKIIEHNDISLCTNKYDESVYTKIIPTSVNEDHGEIIKESPPVQSDNLNAELKSDCDQSLSDNLNAEIKSECKQPQSGGTVELLSPIKKKIASSNATPEGTKARKNIKLNLKTEPPKPKIIVINGDPRKSSDKKVVFIDDPEVREISPCHNGLEGDESQKKILFTKKISSQEKKRVIDMVIAHLMPVYKRKTVIDSREKFKTAAKTLSDELLREKSAKIIDEEMVKRQVYKYCKSLKGS